VLETVLDIDPDEEREYYEQFDDGILYQLGLEQIPLFDPSEGDWYNGRICLVPEYAVRIEVVDYKELRKGRPKRKKKTEKMAYGLNFARRVWRDDKGEFIDLLGERIALDNPMVKVVSPDGFKIHEEIQND
jgi:hypothetical protein